MNRPEIFTQRQFAPDAGNPFNSSPRVLALSSATTSSSTRGILFFHRLLWKRLKEWWQHVYNAFLVAARSSEIALRLSPVTFLMPLCLITHSNSLSDFTWRYTISAVQAMGPVAIKFCQWVATRRDIFPPQLCDRLAILHDRGFPHSWPHTHQVLVEAFGENYEANGLHIDKDDPTAVIGCGSAAQVYRATLRTANPDNTSSSRRVAVKVLHPEFALAVERDLGLLQTIAEWLHSLPSDAIRMLNLPKATQNFGDILRLQADLTKEAENLKQFRKNFHNHNSTIDFPQPVPQWSHPNVLVEDYVPEARPIASFLHDSTPEGEAIRKELAGPLLRAFLKMVFVSIWMRLTEE